MPEGCRHNALGLVVDEANDRVIVRVAALQFGHLESWWIYRLSTATAICKQDLTRLSQDAQPRAGRPADSRNAVDVWRFYRSVLQGVKPPDSGGLRSTDGATFALLDLQGRLVWSLELPNDYTVLANKQPATFTVARRGPRHRAERRTAEIRPVFRGDFPAGEF